MLTRMASDYELGEIRTDRGLYIDKGNRVFDVRHRDFEGGAHADGVHDDRRAIQSALDFAASKGGGIVYLPPGTYLIGDELTVGDNITVMGAGIDRTTVKIGVAQGGTWNAAFVNAEFNTVGNVGGANFNLGFRDFTIDGQVASRSTDPATGLAFKAVSGLRVERVRFTDLHETISGGNGAGIVLLRTDDDEHNEDIHVTGCEFVDFEGYAIAASDTVGGYIAGNVFRDIGNGIWWEPNDAVGGTGDNAGQLRIVGNLFDTMLRAVVIYGDGAPDEGLRLGGWCVVANNVLIECSIVGMLIGAPYSSVTGNIVYAAGGMVAGGIRAEKSFITVSGNTVVGAGEGPGIFMGGTLAVQYGIVVTGNISMNNGDAGIYLSMAEDCIVSGNRCGDNQDVKTQGRSIWEAADCDNNVIAFNHVSDFVTVGITRTGAYTTVNGNTGFASGADGTATVISGDTTVLVTHGLGLTPELADISVTPTNDLGNAAKFWISTPTATQFTINVDVNPGATTATFAWKASV